MVLWLCRCDCGAEKTVRANTLRAGKTLSCGCLQRGLKAGERDRGIGFKNVVNRLRWGAESRGFAYELDDDTVEVLSKKPCAYCGHPPSGRTQGYVHSGIDRIDATRGYHIDNVVPCCKACNIAKHTMTRAQFLAWIERVYLHSIALVRDAGARVPYAEGA